PIRPHEIESLSQMRSATGGHRAAAPGGEPRGDWRREGPQHNELARARRSVPDPVPRSSLGRWPTRPGAIVAAIAAGDSVTRNEAALRVRPRALSDGNLLVHV